MAVCCLHRKMANGSSRPGGSDRARCQKLSNLVVFLCETILTPTSNSAASRLSRPGLNEVLDVGRCTEDGGVKGAVLLGWPGKDVQLSQRSPATCALLHLSGLRSDETLLSTEGSEQRKQRDQIRRLVEGSRYR